MQVVGFVDVWWVDLLFFLVGFRRREWIQSQGGMGCGPGRCCSMVFQFPSCGLGFFLRLVLKPVCDGVSPGFNFMSSSLCSGVGFSDGGVEQTAAISANMEDPKDLTVIFSFVRVFYVKLVGHLCTLYSSRRCLSLSVYLHIVPFY